MKTIRSKHFRYSIYNLLIVFALGFVSCSDDDDDNSQNNGDIPSGNTEISVAPDRVSLFKNPMLGWVMYSGLGDGLSDTFWDEYDDFQSSVGKVKVSDYATTLFIRGAWTDFNPEEGKYAWDEDVNTKPAQRYKMLVAGAKERGLKLALGFIVDSQDKRYDFTPAYVKNAPGIEGYVTRTGVSTDVWSPYPDNAVFKAYYEKFIQAVADKYDTTRELQFMSGTGLGKWGESHTVRYSTEDDEPREEIFDWVTDLYATAFKNTPVMINYHRCILSRSAWYDTGDDKLAMAAKLLDKAVAKGFCLRHDAFGMKGYYKTWEKNYANSYKYKTPFIGEGGWVKLSHGSSIKNDGYATYADVRVGEFEDATNASANMLDFRYSKDIVNGETFSWFNDAYTLVERFIQEGGYRLYPDKVSVPSKVKNGSTVTITHRWLNLGWGYCPTNLPQLKDRYKVTFALLDKNTFAPKYLFADEDAEMSNWIKGKPTSYRLSTKIENVTAGNYIWAVGIVDSKRDNEIGIQIAAKNNRTEEGWVKLMEVSID